MGGKEVLPSYVAEIDRVDLVKNELCVALKNVREELDDHLDTINQATEEVQSSQEYLNRLDEKVDKLSEQVEQIMLFLKGSDLKNMPEKKEFELLDREKDVFLVLYTAGEKPLTYAEIAEGVRESEFLVSGYVTSLIQKGIPVRKRFVNNEPVVQLDSKFKEMQAKTNILNIQQKTVREFC